MMLGYTLNEAPCFEHLLKFRFIPDLKLSSYTQSIAKVAGKMFNSLFYSRKYLTPPTVLYLDKSQIRNQKWNMVTISGKELSNLLFPALTEFKSTYEVMNYFPPYTPSPPQTQYCKLVTLLLFPWKNILTDYVP